MAYLNIGVDLSVKGKNVAYACTEDGKEILENFKFNSTIEDLDALCEKVKQSVDADGQNHTKLRFICEPTNMGWFPLAVYCKTHNHEIVRVKSQKSHDLRKFFNRHKKSDKIEAKVLAKMPQIDKEATTEMYLADKDLFALESFCRQKKWLKDECTKVKNKLRSIYNYVMPNLMECFNNPFSKVALTFYFYFTSPFSVIEAGKEEIKEILESHTKEKIEDKLIDKIFEVAEDATKLYKDAEKYIEFSYKQTEVRIYLELLDNLQQLLEQVNAQIKQLYDKVHPSKNIETFMGVKNNLGASIYSGISEPNRFPSQRKFRGFIGYYPKQDASGDTDKKGLPITKEGPKRLKCDLFLVADCARRHDPQIARKYFIGMMYKGYHHTQAVCACVPSVANRLLRIVKEDRPYELRDVDGRKVTPKEAREIIQKYYTVPEEIRKRRRNKKRSRKIIRERIQFNKRQQEMLLKIVEN